MLVFFNYSFVETYNALMTIAVVSSETDNMSRTEIAFGILRDMKAAGLGKAIGVLKDLFPCYPTISSTVGSVYYRAIACIKMMALLQWMLKTRTPFLRILLQLVEISIYIKKGKAKS